MSKCTLFLVSYAVLMSACILEAEDEADAVETPDAGSIESRTLSFDFSSLPQLGDDFVYEGWLIVEGAPVTSGRFSVDDQGVTSPAEFDLDIEQADAATVFVLTIEPAVDDVPEPSHTHILAGAIESGAASLSANHPAALGTDFSDAAGSYILATPTTGDGTLQEQGIWWLNPGDTKTAGLDLPTLPDGWAYEGWVVGSDGPISTGRFVDAAGADDDGAGADKGDVGDGPAFPGQDFINPAMVLNDGATVTVISVEPDPDNSGMPFLIKPLVHNPIGAEVAPTSHVMANNAAATLPAGSLSID